MSSEWEVEYGAISTIKSAVDLLLRPHGEDLHSGCSHYRLVSHRLIPDEGGKTTTIEVTFRVDEWPVTIR